MLNKPRFLDFREIAFIAFVLKSRDLHTQKFRAHACFNFNPESNLTSVLKCYYSVFSEAIFEVNYCSASRHLVFYQFGEDLDPISYS